MIRKFVSALARRLPLRRIEIDGLPYLDRYYLAGPMPPQLAAFWPEENRPRERLGWLSRTWYLHRFYRPDQDRHQHNHPWDAVGLILVGGYMERRGTEVRWLLPGSVQRLRPDTYHRISLLTDDEGGNTDEVWTLFGTGPKAQSWGYLVGGEHVGWKDYKDKELSA